LLQKVVAASRGENVCAGGGVAMSQGEDVWGGCVEAAAVMVDLYGFTLGYVIL